MVQIGELIQEGRSKRMYATDDPRQAILYFKDEAMAYNGLKRGRILGKGEVNNAVCRTFFELITDNHIPNHYISQVDSRQSLIWRCNMIPIVVMVRNRVAGTLAERTGLPMGKVMDPPVVEFTYKRPDLDNPLINVSHILAMKLASRSEMDYITAVALRINEILSAYMDEIDIELIDFKLEFGRLDGEILVADEISPDVARFWDARTHEPLDIDRFRRDLGDAEQAYQELLHRMMGMEE
ncbi:MAG: phosphoribosylaminoimidazolesuccinocarboxamide synthase [Clostridia bacterium]|nr:phosphoribosylaminoimidazolesuccinocarboxamide synthase [Clostridia bacterium]